MLDVRCVIASFVVNALAVADVVMIVRVAEEEIVDGGLEALVVFGTAVWLRLLVVSVVSSTFRTA